MKRLALLFSALAISSVVCAHPVSRSEASALAAAFLKQPHVEAVPSDFEQFYIFKGDSGFVIISSDDVCIPILAYSFNGSFSSEMPEATHDWLQEYDRAIQALKASGADASDEVRAAWKSLREQGRMPSLHRSSVLPLIPTNWSQRPPYNMYCPGGSLTGCVATTMAQIMRYWEWPIQGTGSYSYTHPTYGTLSATFGATTYDWLNMWAMVGENSPAVVKNAVATLMYHCGVSVDMNYGPESSSASASKMVTAMTTYFDYASSIALAHQYDYTNTQWKQLLKDELDAMRPMCYVGQTRASAHAFICDGYDEQGLFHFNWGWAGTYDGYYAIGALNPGSYGSYNENNYAVVGIHPSSGSVPAIPAPVNLNVWASGNDLNMDWSMAHPNTNYKYNVSRNGVLVAAGLTEMGFVDRNVPSGAYTYQVWAVLNGVESNRKAEYEIEVAAITVTSANPSQGSVTGGGIEEIDFLHTVNATPKPGFVFQCWKENDEVVSTDAEYRFAVFNDRHLVAYFSGLGVEETVSGAIIRQIDLYSLNGVKMGTWKGNLESFDLKLRGYAQGVYLLRLTTDEGVIVKKVICSE